jgi:hypothetical protein
VFSGTLDRLRCRQEASRRHSRLSIRDARRFSRRLAPPFSQPAQAGIMFDVDVGDVRMYACLSVRVTDCDSNNENHGPPLVLSPKQ